MQNNSQPNLEQNLLVTFHISAESGAGEEIVNFSGNYEYPLALLMDHLIPSARNFRKLLEMFLLDPATIKFAKYVDNRMAELASIVKAAAEKEIAMQGAASGAQNSGLDFDLTPFEPPQPNTSRTEPHLMQMEHAVRAA